MNKTQAAAVLALGVALGAGGGKAIDAIVPQGAVAAVLSPSAHAVDLRRKSEKGPIDVTVYATRYATDGGVGRDVGQAEKCAPGKKTTALMTELMDSLPHDCVWRP